MHTKAMLRHQQKCTKAFCLIHPEKNRQNYTINAFVFSFVVDACLKSQDFIVDYKSNLPVWESTGAF